MLVDDELTHAPNGMGGQFDENENIYDWIKKKKKKLFFYKKIKNYTIYILH